MFDITNVGMFLKFFLVRSDLKPTFESLFDSMKLKFCECFVREKANGTFEISAGLDSLDL